MATFKILLIACLMTACSPYNKIKKDIKAHKEEQAKKKSKGSLTGGLHRHRTFTGDGKHLYK